MINGLRIRKHCFVWLPIFTIALFLVRTFSEHGTKFRYNLSSYYINQNNEIITDQNISLAKMIFSNSNETLKKNPISDRAMAQAAFSTYIIDPDDVDMRFISLARKRNPRNRTALKFSLWDSIKQNNAASVIKEADILYRLERSNRKYYQQLFSNIYKTQSGRSILNQSLQKTPKWGYSFLMNEIKLSDVINVKFLLSSIDAFLLNLDDERFKKNLISSYSQRLITLKRYNEAVIFWNSNSEHPVQKYAIFNADFMKLGAPEPFNWIAYNNSSVSTEYSNPKGMFVSFRGSRSSVIIKQYVQWRKSNSIRLILGATHKYDENKGKFFIEIRCAGTNKLIGSHDISQSSSNGELQEVDILTLRKDCEMAHLQLKASPGKFPRPIVLTLDHLDIQFLDNVVTRGVE